jgi:hypothetical protein
MIDCLTSQIIPANPDISGYGIRVAIYIQNLLSFIPAFYALLDGKISEKELEVVEKQSTTILITAFAVLISAMVQAATFGLYSFHTSIILSLSWMNNTNTFIYFLLYIHHKIDSELGDKRVVPRWSAWFYHVLNPFGMRGKSAKGHDAEASSMIDHNNQLFLRFGRTKRNPLGSLHATRSQREKRKWPVRVVAYDPLRSSSSSLPDWARACWSLLRRKFVLVLGSLHLTAMAALGIWMWSSPSRYEATQANRLNLTSDKIPLQCTNTTLLGVDIPLTSAALNRTSLVFYSVFLAPCLNLVVPAVFFLLLFMRYEHSYFDSTTSLFVNALVFVITKPIARIIIFMKPVWPILTGLSFLLAINIVFIIDIETTIKRAIPYQDATDESNWTFGQTLALLLLVLPMRDVYDYIKESREAEYAAQCTEDIKHAVKWEDLDLLHKAILHAGDVNVYIDGMFV